jgi:hypothetical protein
MLIRSGGPGSPLQYVPHQTESGKVCVIAFIYLGRNLYTFVI